MCQYIFEVVVGITDKGEAVFYDVVDMVPTNFDIKNAESPTTATTQNAIGDIHGNSAKNSLPQNSEKSSGNAKYSLSEYFDIERILFDDDFYSIYEKKIKA